MGDKINKEFEEYQKELEIRNKKLKTIIHFESDEKIDDVLNELKDKKMTL